VFSIKRACAGAFVGLLCAGAAAVPASAHQGNPNMRSIPHGITPPVNGVQVQVLNNDDRFELDNQSGKTITVIGYDSEPYAQLLANGTVEVNKRSPAYYLNDDRYAQTTVPPSAKADAPPQWVVQSKTGRFQWHDHRMHWMAKTTPPQVKDIHKKTKIFDYKIPLEVNGKPATLNGTLMWVGPQGGSVPVAAVVALAVIALGLLLLVVIVRRRRAGTTGVDDGSREHAATEAW
jgi:hypothetical protein